MADKPNILVIWGDDIGITNLSCYSDGLMGYRTPNIDRIANEGDALHGLLRRAELHRRPRRRSSPGRASSAPGSARSACPGAGRAAGRGSDHRRAAQAARLRDRPVRQEPPRRPQRVPADRARLRRVLRQPLPPERRGGARAPGLPAKQASRSSRSATARAACCAAGRRARTTRRSTRAGAASASRGSRTRAR